MASSVSAVDAAWNSLSTSSVAGSTAVIRSVLRPLRHEPLMSCPHAISIGLPILCSSGCYLHTSGVCNVCCCMSYFGIYVVCQASLFACAAIFSRCLCKYLFGVLDQFNEKSFEMNRTPRGAKAIVPSHYEGVVNLIT